MIGLPRYVRPIKGGRYHYYERHRGTAQEWPRILVPGEPLSEGFGRRITQLERLELGADLVLRFVDCTDRRHDLPAPSDSKAFWAAIDKAEEIGRKLQAGERKTFSALIADFKNSDAWKEELSEGSQTEYTRYLTMIETAWGDDPVRDLTPEDAQKAIDSFTGRQATARYFRAVLSRLIGWGIPRGYRNDNPVENTEKPSSDDTYEPWEAWQFELYFEFFRVDMHLPVYSGLFTGQRASDVFGMKRPKPSATEMPLIAQKTGELVPVQIHSEYRAIIKATQTDHIMLHLRTDGGAWSQSGFETAWQRQMTCKAAGRNGREITDAERAAMQRLREARTVFHGLRKNAVINLLECGCTEKMVEKIVGMSPAMVAHYAKRVNGRRLAIEAMKRLESGWSEVRKNLFGAAK